MANNTNIGEILAQIEQLQASEQSLIAQLDAATAAPGFNPNTEPILSLVANINNISDSRQALFNSISNQAKLVQTDVANSRVDLVAQLTLLKTVESQLNDSKNAIDKLQNRNDTQMRLVQINTYYGQRYESHSNLMKKLIVVCVPLLVLIILKKKSLLPETISKYAIGITIAVGAIYIIRDLWDIFTRSNMNYDEYDWKYEDPSKQSPSIWQYNKDHLYNFSNPLKNLMKNLGVCIGESCCGDGLAFDKKTQKCVTPQGIKTSYTPPPAAATTTPGEGFKTKGGLGATIVANYDDAGASAGGYQPFSEISNYASIQ